MIRPKCPFERFEEISRVASEIQDSLITVLSEKMMAVPELGFHLAARRGFEVAPPRVARVVATPAE